VALLALLIVLLLPDFVLVGVAVVQMALPEQSLGGISIVSLVVFVIKVGECTFGTKVMLHLRMGQQAKGGEGHHRKKDRRKIDNRSISSYDRTRNYRASNRQSFGNFIPFALQEHRKPDIFSHSHSTSQKSYVSDIQSLKTHKQMPQQGQSSRQDKMAARVGETVTKIVPVQAGAMTSALSLFPLPHQLGAPYFDGINVTEFLACWKYLTMDWTDGQCIKKMPLYCKTSLGLYIKELDIYREGESWNDFTIVLKSEFREDDSEQMHNTEIYLQSLVQKIRK